MLLILLKNSATKRYMLPLFRLMIITLLTFTFLLFLCVFWLHCYLFRPSQVIIPQRVDKLPKLLSRRCNLRDPR